MADLIPLIDRIIFDEVTGCWNWRGSKNSRGYGQAYYRGRFVSAHRLSAFLWLHHPLKSALLVCHKCDNPACFNPKHLFIGTDSDNARDCVSKQRNYQTRKTHCPRGHEYSPENTIIILDRPGAPHRKCLTCERSRNRIRMSAWSKTPAGKAREYRRNHSAKNKIWQANYRKRVHERQRLAKESEHHGIEPANITGVG